MKILITGGAGFIGSSLIKFIINNTNHSVINVDNLTYASNLNSLDSIKNSKRYYFKKVDICNKSQLKQIFIETKPNAIMHLAAESHVDNSIRDPIKFINTNIIGTFNLLEISRLYFNDLDHKEKRNFRFHHISTDEVFGDLENTEDLFSETTAYKPSSPYSASKASSDHLVRAWHRTYGLPALVTNCSNNYGPNQFPEKLIPNTILSALNNKSILIYGNGQQIRDWLYVDDHAEALYLVLQKGVIGETYNIGGNCELQNIKVAHLICKALDKYKPLQSGTYSNLIEFVPDRPGHDLRYAINSEKIKNELGWTPNETFNSGIKKTVRWYIDNKDFFKRID